MERSRADRGLALGRALLRLQDRYWFPGLTDRAYSFLYAPALRPRRARLLGGRSAHQAWLKPRDPTPRSRDASEDSSDRRDYKPPSPGASFAFKRSSTRHRVWHPATPDQQGFSRDRAN